MKFKSSVKKIQFIGKNFVLGVSADSYVQLFDHQSNEVFFFKQGAHKTSVLDAAVDAKEEFLATLGSDGYVNINKIED